MQMAAEASHNALQSSWSGIFWNKPETSLMWRSVAVGGMGVDWDGGLIGQNGSWKVNTLHKISFVTIIIRPQLFV